MSDPPVIETIVQLRAWCQDNPIITSDNDVLERNTLVLHLADEIIGWNCDRSLVVALYGRWGSGKSSIKNLLLQELQNRGKNQPEPVEPVDFNPWQWESGKLSEAFFREIARGIRKADNSNNGEKAAARFVMYGTAAMLTGTVGYAAYTLQYGGVDSGQAATLLATIGTYFKFIGNIIKALREGMTAEAEFRRKSLPEMKKDLASYLKKMKRPVFVIIDDIDRLADNEIQLLFQLVKAQTDFPKLIFLLLCDREIVAKALGKDTSDDGDRFLRKIIHSGYNVPYAGTALIEKELINGINILLKHYPALFDFDDDAFAKVFITGCRTYFTNLRDVKRFIAGLDFHFRVMTVNGVLEVNPVDSFVIELLRQFEPDVYAALPEARFMLTGEPFSPILEYDDIDRKRVYDSIMAKAYNPIIGEILELIFPRLSRVRNEEESMINDREDESRRMLHVCHYQIFDRYFTCSIPSGQIAESILGKVVGLSTDSMALLTEFQSAIQNDNFGVLLVQLGYYRHEIVAIQPESFITGLFDIEPNLPEVRVGLRGHPIEWEVVYLIEDILRAAKDSASRKAILAKAINRTSGLLIPVIVLRHLDHTPSVSTEKTIAPDDFIALRKIGLQRIITAAKKGSLYSLSISRLVEILYAWALWDSTNAQSWILEYITGNDHRLMQLLYHFYHPHPGPFASFDVQVIRKIIPVETIIERVLQIDMTIDAYTEADKRLVADFMHAAQNEKTQAAIKLVQQADGAD